ncbi:MAG: hypothetical protein E7661_09625 [Ruminococcaceae bacterium]|nr:hypothetical protein [Oscillospiraceae bacterium]
MNVMTAFTPETAYGAYGRRDRMQIRRGILGCGTGFTVAMDEKGILRYAGDNRWGQKDAAAWQELLSISCGPDFVLGLCKDGSVRSAGRSDLHRIDVNRWACVTAIACGQRHAAALVGNGQVLASGDNRFGQCETGTWSDVIDICCGNTFTVGLRQDGRLLVAGGHKLFHQILNQWKNIAGLFSDAEGKQVLAITFGEGRLISTASLPACTRKWRNLVYAAASARGVMAVTATGRLLTSNKADRKRLEQMTKDFIACAAGATHMAALCRSGEVIALGHNDFGQCSTTRWGALFRGFEAFTAHRKDDVQKKENTERIYQQRLSEAGRFSRRLACGERLAACIRADGHVEATAGLRRVKDWHDVCALSCGSAHLLALHKNGTVSADGNNVGGCCRVSDWKNVKAVVAGKYHSLGLCEDGTVLFAGWNVHGQGRVSEWQGIHLLRSTDTYTVGVSHDGKIYTSGNRLPFDPGDINPADWADLVDLVVSVHHMVGLRKDGRVVAVGDHAACDVSAWRGVRAIAAGEGFTVGLCYGGHVLATGVNQYGQCNTESWMHVVSVACGRSFTAGLLADGRVVTAGQHMSGRGQMLTPDEIGSAVMDWEKAEATGYEPFHTDWMADVLTLRCGQEYLVAVDRYGQVMAEGLDLDGQCTATSTFVLFRDIRQMDGFGVYTVAADLLEREKANGQDMPKQDETATVSGKEAAREITISGLMCADTLLPWDMMARDRLGQVGQGLTHYAYLTEQGTLKMVGEELSRREERWVPPTCLWVSSGLYHTVAITNEGRLWSVGLLKEDPTAELLETQSWEALDHEEDVMPWTAVTCGINHTAAIRSDGRVFAVGDNDEGQCGVDSFRDVITVACGAKHTVAVTKEGVALAVGNDTYGQCRVQDWKNLVMVACGERHTVGLLLDGSVIAVGDDRLGQCRVERAKNVISVACLPEATICVRADGRVDIYGGTGELRERIARLRRVVAVYVCEYRLCALTSDGRLLEVN